MIHLIILCIGSTSPIPLDLVVDDVKVCQREASKVRNTWNEHTMLHRCEAYCVDTSAPAPTPKPSPSPAPEPVKKE